ncbi:MAG TPA: cysteine peptidase family C39 domain-containing protein [Candidatus Methylomirabilis sp.]|nr:cysteine peptidase family C39 domain-containing protein [Candidatus Methylomirabilis sp.]
MKISEFPCLNQVYDYDCGAKATEAVLAYYGQDVDEQTVMKMAGTTSRYGTPLKGIERTLRHFGLKLESKKMTIRVLKKYLDREIPVIILLQAWPANLKQKIDWKNWWQDGHYVVAIGYDKKKIYFEDPMCNMRTYLTFKELQDRWHDVLGREKKVYRNRGMAVFGHRQAFDINKAVHMG